MALSHLLMTSRWPEKLKIDWFIPIYWKLQPRVLVARGGDFNLVIRRLFGLAFNMIYRVCTVYSALSGICVKFFKCAVFFSKKIPNTLIYIETDLLGVSQQSFMLFLRRNVFTGCEHIFIFDNFFSEENKKSNLALSLLLYPRWFFFHRDVISSGVWTHHPQ
jgi:hypothetical protein